MLHRALVASAIACPLLLTLPGGCIVLPDDSDSDTEGTSDTDSTGDTSDPSDSASDSGTSGQTSDDDSSGDDDPTEGTGPVPAERAVDIIFVVDNSGSMGEEQAKLTASIDALVDALDAAVPPVDYRIAVTTTDSGNPWCQGTTSENGQFVGTSCRSRTSDFVFEGALQIDVTDEACLDICATDDLSLPDPWIDVQGSTGTTNVPSGDVREALSCMLPQGINGCGFEQPLESLRQAMELAEAPMGPNAGFRRPGALLAVALFTDEADCSNNPAHETVFLPDGNRVFWSDPNAPAPTSAVCWNAGVQCANNGGVVECSAADFDVSGNPVAGDPETNAVLNPLSGYIADLTSRGAYVTAINGVGSDGQPTYGDGTPEFEHDFGVGEGCSGPVGSAVPPVRVRELVDDVTGPGNLHSICDDTFDFALNSMAQGILTRLP